MIRYERQNLLSGSGAAEAPHFLAMLKQYHGGKASYPVVPGQFHVLPSIHLELGQANGTFQVCQNVRQYRCYNETGGAPLGPEIDQNRPLGGSRQYVPLKRLQICIVNGHAMWAVSTPQRTGRCVFE